jgi:DNA-binding response OmpR family regulator
MRALVVDDELATRILLTGLARANGLEVVAAADGDEAWELYKARPFPMVMTDWMMPKMSGIELTQKIRAAQTADAYTYILVITTLSAREHTLRAFEAGADDMLCKPVDAEQIAARLAVGRRFLGAHARRAEEAYLSSLETMQAELGHEHSSLAGNLSALSKLYRGQGAIARARAFLRREIDVLIAAEGERHPRVDALRAELASMK